MNMQVVLDNLIISKVRQPLARVHSGCRSKRVRLLAERGRVRSSLRHVTDTKMALVSLHTCCFHRGVWAVSKEEWGISGLSKEIWEEERGAFDFASSDGEAAAGQPGGARSRPPLPCILNF